MANNQSKQNPVPVPTGNDPACKLGRRSITVPIDFTLGLQFQLDMSQIQSLGAFDAAQTLYIDNSANTGELTITMGLTLQNVIIPAGAQAYMPILQTNPPVLKFNSAAAVQISVQILNFFVPPCVWFPAGIAVTDLTLQSVISGGRVLVSSTAAVVTGPTDESGTITAGGTRQVLMAANSARKRFIISNPSSATEILQFSYVTNTAGLIDLAPGDTWDEADDSVSGDEIWIVAATTGHAFTSYQW